MGMSIPSDFKIYMYSFTMMFLNPNMKIMFHQNRGASACAFSRFSYLPD